ncbi:MAG: NmrA/HSCARG family protein [Candidatus Acidiferrales bacterium]
MILVTGATGKQGGAVASQLLSRRVPVRALVRDRRKPAAQAIALRGIELVRGDLSDRASLDKALEGVTGVFSVQALGNVEAEVRQGITLADAAKAAGVKHFVYSSVASAGQKTGIPHFESKLQIEEHIRKIGLPSTILRPVFFMDNWSYQREFILAGTISLPLDPDRTLQQIAVQDIGVFAAMAFADPAKWIGRAIELAGDELTMNETAAVFSEVTGHKVNYVQMPWDKALEIQGKELTVMFRWLNDVGFNFNIGELRKIHPGLSTLKVELNAQDWSQPAAGSART